jgi:hypothetical protein
VEECKHNSRAEIAQVPTPENKEERTRKLEELKGKNVAQYQVLLTAWIHTKMEHDKTLVTISIGGIGYLISVLTLVGIKSFWEIPLFLGGFSGFLITLFAALSIYKKNAQHLENELRESVVNNVKPKLDQLDQVIMWAFRIAVGCAIFIGISVGWSKYMANSNRPQQSQATAPEGVNKSLSGIENLRPQSQKQSPTQTPSSPADSSTAVPPGGQGGKNKGSSK